MDKIEELKKMINESNKIVVLTGAGVSTDSGIKDFRGKDLRTYKKSRDIMNDLCWYFHLPKSFIRKYADILNWNCICTYQELEEKFIEEMKDKINWEMILLEKNFLE